MNDVLGPLGSTSEIPRDPRDYYYYWMVWLLLAPRCPLATVYEWTRPNHHQTNTSSALTKHTVNSEKKDQ